MAFSQALRVRVEQKLPATVVALDGELHASDVSGLRRTLLKCLIECPDALVVDLGRVSSVPEEVALAVFRSVRKHASVWPAVPLFLCSPTLAVAAKLARTGLERIIPVYRTRAAALAATAVTPSIARADRQFAPTIHAPAQARELIGELCQAWDLPDIAELAQLIVSELVTNAVTHAGGGLRFTAVLRPTQLHLVVRDPSPEPPHPRETVAAPGHRFSHGLRLVDALADSWGYLANGTGKAVWALLRIAPDSAPA